VASRMRVLRRGVEVDLEAWVRRRTSHRLRELGAFDQQNLEADLLPRVGVVFRRQERRLFASEGASGGPPWRELDPDYARRKAVDWPGRKILAASGQLRQDLTSESSPDYIQEVELRGREAHLRLGTGNPLARYHTVDGVRRRLDKPRRSGRRKPRRAPRSARRQPVSRSRPTFSGVYEFVRRSVTQRTAEQREEFRDVIRAYVERRAVAPVRRGFAASDSEVATVAVVPVLGAEGE